MPNSTKHEITNDDKFYTIEDDYENACDLTVSEVRTMQMGSVGAEMGVENEIAIIKMHAEIDRGELVMEDPRMKEAQRKAATRQNLIRPQ